MIEKKDNLDLFAEEVEEQISTAFCSAACLGTVGCWGGCAGTGASWGCAC
ncbi:thiocillin family RiPP [Bacillus sp. JCM 19041]